LLEIIQMGAIEVHPWGAPVDTIDYPDRMIFDLDPAPGVPFAALKSAARDLRRRLQVSGLESKLKCTGGKGLHVTVPLSGKDDWASVKAFAAALAHELVQASPAAYIATMAKVSRPWRRRSARERSLLITSAMTTLRRRSRTTACGRAPVLPSPCRSNGES
jgi:bifunctional non-homologous end joining protein LigD